MSSLAINPSTSLESGNESYSEQYENTEVSERLNLITPRIAKELIERVNPRLKDKIFLDPLAGSNSLNLAVQTYLLDQCRTDDDFQNWSRNVWWKENLNERLAENFKNFDIVFTSPPFSSKETRSCDVASHMQTLNGYLKTAGILALPIPLYLYDVLVHDVCSDIGELLSEDCKTFDVEGLGSQEIVLLTIQRYNSELLKEHYKGRVKNISKRFDSNQRLIQALEKAENRLIIVCPWLRREIINDSFLKRLETLLEKDVEVDIGWGFRGDFTKRWHEKEAVVREKEWLYSGLKPLEQMSEKYSNLHLTLVYTHSKYVICDRKWMMIGSHNILTSGSSDNINEAGLVVTEMRISIDEQIQEFDALKKRSLSQPIMGVPK